MYEYIIIVLNLLCILKLDFALFSPQCIIRQIAIF